MKEIMAKTVTAGNGFFDAAKAFGDFRIPEFDVQAIVDVQRKNFEALTRANQLALEGMRSVAQRQAEIVQQAFEEASGLLRDLTQLGAPEERLIKSTEVAKQAFEKGLANARELNELGTKASVDVFGVIARRVSESFDDVRLYAKKQAAAE
jgi:phasin family protein